MSKRLNSYLIQLPLVGFFYLVSAIISAYFLVIPAEYSNISYIAFKFMGYIFGIYVAIFTAKGGNVNFHFGGYKENKDEIKLSNLIEKYKSLLLIFICAILLILSDFILSMFNSNFAKPFDTYNVAGLMIWTSVTIAVMCEGVKYISAWWNIKRNWKKEFKT